MGCKWKTCQTRLSLRCLSKHKTVFLPDFVLCKHTSFAVLTIHPLMYWHYRSGPRYMYVCYRHGARSLWKWAIYTWYFPCIQRSNITVEYQTYIFCWNDVIHTTNIKVGSWLYKHWSVVTPSSNHKPMLNRQC